VTLAFNDAGGLVLRQSSWPDEDHTIIIERDNIDSFIDSLTDALGVPSVGKP
jgi:hypothetical protein